MERFLQLSDGRRIAVRDGMIVGRDARCELALDDGKASRRHARLIVEGSVVEIEDLGSSNGTALNGTKIQRRVLRSGDEIVIGTTALRFVEAAAKAPAATPPLAAAPPAELDLGATAPLAQSVPPAAPLRPAPPARPQRPADAYQPGGGLEGDPLASGPASGRGRADDVDVLEFIDEVVEVKRSAPPRPLGSAAAPLPAAAAARAAAHRRHGVLQFSAQPSGGGKGGVLGQDLRQVSFAARAGLVVGVLVLAAAVAWGAMILVARL
jgi:hypothetical protein